jgi:hypothetical protein
VVKLWLETDMPKLIRYIKQLKIGFSVRIGSPRYFLLVFISFFDRTFAPLNCHLTGQPQNGLTAIKKVYFFDRCLHGN